MSRTKFVPVRPVPVEPEAVMMSGMRWSEMQFPIPLTLAAESDVAWPCTLDARCSIATLLGPSYPYVSGSARASLHLSPLGVPFPMTPPSRPLHCSHVASAELEAQWSARMAERHGQSPSTESVQSLLRFLRNMGVKLEHMDPADFAAMCRTMHETRSMWYVLGGWAAAQLQPTCTSGAKSPHRAGGTSTAKYTSDKWR
jgi:hypothetical protein